MAALGTQGTVSNRVFGARSIIFLATNCCIKIRCWDEFYHDTVMSKILVGALAQTQIKLYRYICMFVKM